jgi:hypothetical protein
MGATIQSAGSAVDRAKQSVAKANAEKQDASKAKASAVQQKIQHAAYKDFERVENVALQHKNGDTKVVVNTPNIDALPVELQPAARLDLAGRLQAAKFPAQIAHTADGFQRISRAEFGVYSPSSAVKLDYGAPAGAVGIEEVRADSLYKGGTLHTPESEGNVVIYWDPQSAKGPFLTAQQGAVKTITTRGVEGALLKEELGF